GKRFWSSGGLMIAGHSIQSTANNVRDVSISRFIQRKTASALSVRRSSGYLVRSSKAGLTTGTLTLETEG
ncbi:hypothetical protein, partial [Syntrophothermus sp.]|uniref:hypothetical protein n=1 Tax=Syntrophothermus sp. TaxID=2736299 RepID=UPI00257E5DC9